MLIAQCKLKKCNMLIASCTRQNSKWTMHITQCINGGGRASMSHIKACAAPAPCLCFATCVFPSFAYPSKLEYVCFSSCAVVSVYSLATIYIFKCIFSRVLVVLVLSFMQSQQVTHQSFRRFDVSYRVYLCLEF